MVAAAVIVAFGNGKRFGGQKQFMSLYGKPVVWHSINTFINHPKITTVVLVSPKNNISKRFKEDFPTLVLIEGGNERQDSVFCGLKILKRYKPSYVLIHDGVRPFVNPKLISNILDELKHYQAVIPGLIPSNTIKKVDQHNIVSLTHQRPFLRSIQTPQGFSFPMIYDFYKKNHNLFTDDAGLFEENNIPVKVIEGDPQNKKITYISDLPLDIRTGNGFDVHAICKGDYIALFGIKVEAGFSLIGHSDADVGLHSITDALLGTISDGDIGVHFPPNDSKWKGADSSVFLKFATDQIKKSGGIINHIDTTFIGELPKINAYRNTMRQRIADIIGISLDRVSLKATTTEQLGFLGRKEGIAVQSTVTVLINNSFLTE